MGPCAAPAGAAPVRPSVPHPPTAGPGAAPFGRPASAGPGTPTPLRQEASLGYRLHRRQHPCAQRARGRAFAPRHVRSGRHRDRRLPSAAHRDHRQRDRRGARRLRQGGRGRAARRWFRLRQRRRPRDPGGRHEGRRAPRDRGDLHRTARRRQVRLQRLQGVGRPPRRRLLGGQRALHVPRGGRLPRRSTPSDPLRLRRRHVPRAGRRGGARRARGLHRDLPPRPRDLQGGRGVRVRPRPPPPARPRLPHRRRADRARGPAPDRRQARGLPRGGGRGGVRRAPRPRGQAAVRRARAHPADGGRREGRQARRRSRSRSA